VAGIVALWEGACRVFEIREFVLPAPWVIARHLTRAFPLYLGHTWVTVQEIVIGFLAGSAIGLIMAVGIVQGRALQRSLYPLLVLFQTVPKAAIAPLLILWFGYGILPKVVLVAILAFFPVTVDGILGLKSIEPSLVDLLRSVSASRWQILWKIQMPHALPHIFAGLRVGSTFAVIGAILAEWVGANAGLGYLIMSSGAELKMDRMFAGIFAASMLGVALFYAIALVERWLLPWHRTLDLEKAIG
jgi:ABC-type nitrate/sulfonate/bicarbonate transport system permease component